MQLKLVNPCGGCVLRGDSQGFVPPSGSGDNGVLIIGEAAGASEAEQGEGFVGKSGLYLFSQLKRAGIDREGFRIANVLCCQPKVSGFKENALVGTPYENEAIATCSPLLDSTIGAHVAHCAKVGKTPTIVTLGRTAFKRVMGLSERSPIMKEDYLCYPFWSERYGAWVLAGDHPSYLMRGNHHLVPVLQFAFGRALEIASDGFSFEQPTYILDPEPAIFAGWIADFKVALAADPENVHLSYDIETPYKKGKSEDALASLDDESFHILRCSFAYREDCAVSVPWTEPYKSFIGELFASQGIIFGWNNNGYDDERVLAQLPIKGTIIDGMIAWHVLNSTLPKGLGFVTPFYAKRFPMWKHLNNSQPALYNAMDALAALKNWNGIRQGLKDTGLWPVYDRHVLQLNKALSYMSQKGLARDEAFRDECEGRLTEMLDEVESLIQAVIPMEARRVQVYKKAPKSTDGMVQVVQKGLVKRCSACGLGSPTKPHFKVLKKSINPCAGADVLVSEEDVSRWGKPLPWRISLKGLLAYQKVMGHAAIRDKRTKKITFDKNAKKRLIKAHPSDPLYPLLGRHAYLQKMRSTYVGVRQEDGRIKGGMPMGPDGFGHPAFTHNPSTLRLSCPFFHTLPRPDKKRPDEPHSWIRNMVIPREGHTFLARDFSGIEAVLVGYEAKDQGYTRLALRDVHSFYTAYALYQLDGRISANDLPLLSWDDDRLFSVLAGIKEEFGADRNSLYKHLVHAINFGQGAEGAIEKIYKETNVMHPVPLVKKVMGIYKELFPAIPRWHDAVREEAHEKGFLTNAFGYIHRFSHVYKNTFENGQWVRRLGDDAEATLAFRPQSNAAGIIKESIIRLYFDRFEEAGKHLRLQIHDENFTEPPTEELDRVDRILQEEMERPIPQMPLPPEWGMGPFLRILTEPKSGPRWGAMK